MEHLTFYPSHCRADLELSPVRNVRRQAHIETGQGQNVLTLTDMIIVALEWRDSNCYLATYTTVVADVTP